MNIVESKKQIELYAMNRKGLAVVESLLAEFGPHIFARIITASDPNNLDDCCFEITELCAAHRIPVFKKNEEFPRSEVSYAITVGWRWMIETDGFKRIIVLHDALLPKYRGFAPLVAALINKESRIGVTALFAVGNYDAGDIIMQKWFEVEDQPLRIRDAISRVSELYSEIAAKIVRDIISDIPLVATPQDESKATYCLWRDDDDYGIDWNQDAETIQRFIYAVDFPYKGASTKIGNKKFRVLDAIPLDDVCVENRVVGKTIFLKDGCPVVVCGSGLLKLIKVVDDSNRENCLPFKNFRLRFS